MTRMVLREGQFPRYGRRFRALIGLLNPPHYVASRMGDSARDALNTIATLVYAEATIGLVMRRPEIALLVECFNADYAPTGMGAWRLPPASLSTGEMLRSGFDPLGLDVPEAWGAEWLGAYYGRHMLAATGVRKQEANGKAADAARALSEIIERATGIGRPKAVPFEAKRIDAARNALEKAIASALLFPPFLVLEMGQDALDLMRARPVPSPDRSDDDDAA